MKFVPPSKVRITNKVHYSVYLVDRFEESNTMGTCCSDTRQILLRSDLSPRQLLTTFIHEVIHAMQFEYGIKIPHESVDQLDFATERLLRLNDWMR